LGFLKSALYDLARFKFAKTGKFPNRAILLKGLDHAEHDSEVSIEKESSEAQKPSGKNRVRNLLPLARAHIEQNNQCVKRQMHKCAAEFCTNRSPD